MYQRFKHTKPILYVMFRFLFSYKIKKNIHSHKIVGIIINSIVISNISIVAVAYWLRRKNQPSSFPWPDIAYLSGPRILIVVVVSTYLYYIILDLVGTIGQKRARARIGIARNSPGSDRLNMRAPRARPHPQTTVQIARRSLASRGKKCVFISTVTLFLCLSDWAGYSI